MLPTREQFAASVCYLETTGRESGNPHEIEIWFASEGDNTLFLLSGGGAKADWVRNIVRTPTVRVRFGTDWFTGTARDITSQQHEIRARQLVAAKYYDWREGPLPNDWACDSPPVEITLS
jgi:deazaflavin-dependent oxidoreductase (nitroreductase family)